MFDVLSLNKQTELKADTDYYFKVEDDGHYFICFVANPGDDMKKKLKKNLLQVPQ